VCVFCSHIEILKQSNILNENKANLNEKNLV